MNYRNKLTLPGVTNYIIIKLKPVLDINTLLELTTL